MGELRRTKTRHLAALSVLLCLFIARVLSQYIQWVWAVDFLPSFEAWHSSTLEYEVLLCSQGLIVAWCAMVIRWVKRGEVKATLGKARALLSFGAVYFVFMLSRLVASLSFAEEGSWFDHPLPSAFHLVLALFVLCYGHFHWIHRSQST